jgi:hypothetical protein
MFPYWLLFGIFALGAVGMRARPNQLAGDGTMGWSRQRDLLFLAAALIPIGMIGFRFQVGGDWYNYMRMFNDARATRIWEDASRIEIGYTTLNSAVIALGLRIWAINLVCGIMFMGGLIQFARRQPNPWLAVVVAIPYLLIGVAMGYSRQGLAIGCLMFGLAAIDKGSFLKFAIWVVVAASFHRTAIVMLPIVAISYSRSRWQSAGLALVAAIGGYYTAIASAMDYYERGYLNSTYDAKGAAVRLAMNLLPAVIFLFFSGRFGVEGHRKRMWQTLSIVAILCMIALFLVSSSVIVDRLGLYIIPLQIFVLSRLPHAFGYRDHPSGGLILLVIVYSAAVQYVFLNYGENAHWWIPYQTYFTADCSFGEC